ncbi:probable multidrug resistance-associated protein lethal(2)03659 [Diorhabda sublineata]|uniref:probable multidrug resistance-associated protein lethal(2)03659 n=1 Tax=Diorhabda sublineata TaxID=1163346 RepID=UPI0024E1142C|nr:probable multidrug resistance-associated protein lethal(2)03659 [Diorhabda sublineata]
MEFKSSKSVDGITQVYVKATKLNEPVHWFPPYIWQGLKTEVDEDNPYIISKTHTSEYLGNNLESAWNKELEKPRPSLLKALFAVFKYEIIAAAFLRFFLDSIKITQPILISTLVSYFRAQADDVVQSHIYICACLLVLSSFIQVICIHQNMLLVLTLGMKIRIAACALVYRKALKLTKSAIGVTTVGQMVNLLSNDVERFDFCCQFIHLLWLAPSEIIIAMVLLYILVGPTGLVGCIFLLAFVPFQPYMAKLVSQYRLKTAICTDERMRLMNDIIAGIQVIKMYTWEKPFTKLVESVRRREIEQIRLISSVRAIMLALSMTLGRLSMLLCVLTYVLSGNTLNAYYVFTVASFYGFLRNSVILLFPQAVIQVAEARVSISRIQSFLLHEEVDANNDQDAIKNIINDVMEDAEASKGEGDVGILIKNAAVKWELSSTEHLLKDVNFEATSNQLVALVGPVGGGKSTLLQVILREIIPYRGTVKVNGTMSYASQEPWIFGGSIKQNILFGQPFDRIKYEEVIRVCALERDFVYLPYGDNTFVGERGCNLSGGQKARLNLARAVYKDADIYLLDDPLSAVDSAVGKQLFNNCINGYLRNKCVVLVTHQVQYLHSTNYIYLLEEGTLRSPSTYHIMKASDRTFIKLLETAKMEEKRDHSLQTQETEPQVIQISKEERATGAISSRVYTSYFRAGGHWTKTLALLCAFIAAQVFSSLTDVFLTIWVNTEQSRAEEKIKHEFWNRLLSIEISLFIYISLIVFTVIFSIIRSIAFFNYCIKASIRLHSTMFTKVIHSPMSFHNSNPSGRILNRFSKDIGSLDETLPTCMLDTLGIGLIVLAIIIVIGAINPYILFPTLILLAMMYYIKQAFLVSSRNIKRLEAVTRSPIYSHLTATLQGITTIRAFGAEAILVQQFDKLQDKFTSAFYMFLTASRGFGFWLDVHCVVYMALIIISLLFIQKETFGGNVGLSLTQAITLAGLFQWGIRQWSELENQMTSVERVQEYADLPTEQDSLRIDPRKYWPERGQIKFENVFLKYAPDESCVLNNLNFDVKSSEKVGIVGRTGAGKSSIIQALFRLAHIDGKILIDNIDTGVIKLEKLRSKISIIPQEPILFSGTLRKNLDPFDEYSDEELWQVLEKVELRNAVDELPSGLESKIAEGGINFSLGQRQLLCLARAIIRNNKILVLDEATANVDPMTDEIIQSTIKEKFENCTVLTIAHRLHTIMDSDKILVMEGGEAVEFGHPYSLLLKKGTFYDLVRETGSTTALNLEAIARESFSKNNN